MRPIWLLLTLLLPALAQAAEAPRRVALKLRPEDVLATGNEWLALQNPDWELLEYWIPQARQNLDGLELTLTYCAPNGYRAAFIRLTASNHREVPVRATLGMKASFGRLSRVTYVPVVLRGERSVGPSPWVDPGEAFSYITHDTQFAWALVHPGSTATTAAPPLALSPEADAEHVALLQPGESTEALFVLAAGLEEFSAAHNARALREMLDRHGADAIIAAAAAWCRARTRSTGRADLDLLMNRNFLFTALYAWGRTIDTEQLVGVTSRSPRYYVSAAYWGRDAMLWSFPGLLDIDPQLAHDALDYALTVQLRNTGTHSRFIDGVVLEDGFQLDEAVAPLVALATYGRATGDLAFLAAHRDALVRLRERLLGRYDAGVGLYSSLQDSQDEYQQLPFITYDNVLSWRALTDMAMLFGRLHDSKAETDLNHRARDLHAAILARMVTSAAPGSAHPIFASATDGSHFAATEIPPGSLMKLPALGFIAEDDPLFRATYDWLHSPNYPYSYSTSRYGLPGSYRLPITTSWMIADELLLKRSHERAESILLASPWDGGIISEGIDPESAHMDYAGRAFATAAGYVAHAICSSSCLRP